MRDMAFESYHQRLSEAAEIKMLEIIPTEIQLSQLLVWLDDIWQKIYS